MKKKLGLGFLIFVLVICLLIFVMSLMIPVFRAKILPTVISAFTLLLCIIELVRELKAWNEPVKAKPKAVDEEEGGYLRGGYLLGVAWIVGLTVGIFLIGFTYAFAIFILAYMKTHDTSWFKSILTTVITIAIIYGLFTSVMEFQFFPGLLFGGDM